MAVRNARTKSKSRDGATPLEWEQDDEKQYSSDCRASETDDPNFSGAQVCRVVSRNGDVRNAAQRGVTREAIVPRRELTERTEEKRRVEGARGKKKKKKKRKGRFRRCKPSAISEGRARGPERRVVRFIASESHHCAIADSLSLFLSPSVFGYTTAPCGAFADSFIGISLVPSFPLSTLYPAWSPFILAISFLPRG